jgi:hypothetical protein
MDDIHEVATLEAGHEVFEEIRLEVAEDGLGLGGDPFRESPLRKRTPAREASGSRATPAMCARAGIPHRIGAFPSTPSTLPIVTGFSTEFSPAMDALVAEALERTCLELIEPP